MAYVPVPKDLTKVKTKVMFNLTRRQLVCFTAGALVYRCSCGSVSLRETAWLPCV